MKTKYSLALVSVTSAIFALTISAGATRTDDRIEAAAKNSYVFKTYLKDDAIDVKSKDGVVTLTGSVADQSQKDLAANTVASLPGVINVDNELQLGNDAPASGSDAWLELKVKSALLFHRNVSANTKVVARDGIITLSGAADSPEQKELATAYVKDVDGVRDVHNEMTLSNLANPPGASDQTETRTLGETIDDASITAEVKMTLLSHQSTSATDVKVKTRHGVVLLTGTARSDAQKDLTAKLVGDLNGVNRIINHITVVQ